MSRILCLWAAAQGFGCDSEEPQDLEAAVVEVPVTDLAGEALEERPIRGEAMADDGDGLMSIERTLEIVKDAPDVPAALALRGGAAGPVDAAAQAAEQARRNTQFIRELAAGDPEADLILTVNLPQVDFDFTRLAGASEAERTRLVDGRQAALRTTQDVVARAVEAAGGKVLHRHWVVNALAVELPARAVETLLREPQVVSLASGEVKVTTGARYDGADVRQAVRSEALKSYGYDGEAQGRTTSPTDNIKIAILDADPLNANHVGWRDTAGGVSRVQKKYDCSSATCVVSTTAPTGSFNHGTRVTSVAAGSILEGQDPAFPGANTAAQRLRSWSATEADIYYYMVGGWSSVALEKAIADGVDIISMSLALSCGGPNNYTCSPLYDCSNINQILRNALDAGVLPLVCAGNGSQGGSGTCDLWWPGYRPETIAVNALDTSNDATAYHDTVFTGYATTGPIPITSYGGTASSTPGVDLLGPGEVSYAYGNGTADYYDMNGCSNATPVVAGAVAVMRQAFKSIGWLGNDARALMVSAFVMGDASNGSTANGESNSAVHNSAGYGRFHAHLPINADLTAPWGWGWRAVRIFNGEELKYSVWDAGPESTLVQDWKMAVMWDAPNLTQVPDIYIYVVDTCAGNAVIAGDYGFAPRKRLHLNQASIGNKCLEMRVKAWAVPPEGTVVYMADYFHSGDTNIN